MGLPQVTTFLQKNGALVASNGNPALLHEGKSCKKEHPPRKRAPCLVFADHLAVRNSIFGYLTLGGSAQTSLALGTENLRCKPNSNSKIVCNLSFGCYNV